MRRTTKRGRPRCRIENQGLSVTVPVTMYEEMQRLSEDEGISLAAWTRRAVIRELRRMREQAAA